MTSISSINIKSFKQIRLDTYLLYIYFALAPFEFVLVSEQGSTWLRYIAAGFIAINVFRSFIIKKNALVAKNRISLSIVYLILITVMSIIWSYDYMVSIRWSITYASLMLLFLFVHTRKYNDVEVHILKEIIIYSGLAVFLYIYVFNPEISQLRPDGRTALGGADPNEFAALMILPLFVLFDKLLLKQNVVYIILFSLFVFIILSTGSRGAFISIFIAFVIYFFRNFSLKRASLLFALTALTIYTTINYLPENIFLRIFSEGAMVGTQELERGRFFVWQIIITNIIPNMPLFGYGSGISGEIIAKYTGYIIGAHNTYLRMILEFGILGLPVFLYFLSKLFILAKKEKNIAKTYLLIAILLIVFFLDANFKKYLWNALIYVAIFPTYYYKTANKSQ